MQTCLDKTSTSLPTQRHPTAVVVAVLLATQERRLIPGNNAHEEWLKEPSLLLIGKAHLGWVHAVLH